MTEKMGKFDSKELHQSRPRHDHHAERGARYPHEASWDKNGDINRESFLAEVVGGKQKIVKILPMLKE